MPDFLPFCGYRFSPDLENRFSQILAPPYDKISAKDLPVLWESDPFNCARLILPPPDVANGDFATQSATQRTTDWYSGARSFLDEWISKGILRRDDPSYYFYRQDFLLDGSMHSRWGVIGTLALKDDDETLLHERTFEGPKADRFQLLKETQANLCSIFAVATDPKRTLIRIAEGLSDPAVDCHTPDGIRHRVYFVTDQETIQATQEAFKTCTLMIADGHHRYETARNYRAWARENLDPSCWPATDGVMVYACPIEQEGLVVLPTHRMIRDLSDCWLDCLAQHPGISSHEASGGLDDLLRDLHARPGNEVAVGATDGTRFVLLVRKGDADPELYRDVHPALRDLDVTFVHHMILKVVLEVDEMKTGRMSYFRNPQEALDRVIETPRSGALFLRPPRADQVMSVSQSGERMPQKSTDFFPKIPTGLVIRLLREPSDR
ncbi:MAG: DUF1015 domain-containing protein [bacterium]